MAKRAKPKKVPKRVRRAQLVRRFLDDAHLAARDASAQALQIAFTLAYQDGCAGTPLGLSPGGYDHLLTSLDATMGRVAAAVDWVRSAKAIHHPVKVAGKVKSKKKRKPAVESGSPASECVP